MTLLQYISCLKHTADITRRLLTVSPPAERAIPQSAMTSRLITRASPSCAGWACRAHAAARPAHERHRTRRTELRVLLRLYAEPGG